MRVNWAGPEGCKDTLRYLKHEGIKVPVSPKSGKGVKNSVTHTTGRVSVSYV